MTDGNALTKELIRLALAEDIGHGDITSLLVADDRPARARITAKESFILAGLPFVREVFSQVDPSLIIEGIITDGSACSAGDTIIHIAGSARSILAGERLALNILQRISGIATLTARFVEKVKGLPVRIVDTRKTTPGMRAMEKYGVVVGGGSNHRFGLYDGILIKDNHIAFAGGVRIAIERARAAHHLLRIEIEVATGEELDEALAAGADVIMLDNMSSGAMAEAVCLIRSRRQGVLIEASGNMTLDRIRAVAETGVDIISVGALTHSAAAVDISLKFEE